MRVSRESANKRGNKRLGTHFSDLKEEACVCVCVWSMLRTVGPRLVLVLVVLVLTCGCGMLKISDVYKILRTVLVVLVGAGDSVLVLALVVVLACGCVVQIVVPNSCVLVLVDAGWCWW